jgi:hypothetical protein
MSKQPKKVKPAKAGAMLGKRTDDPKYAQFRKEHQAGRSGPSTGYKKSDQYSMGVGPRVGGSVAKSTPLASATKKQVKAGKSLVRKGTGSGASAQAKRSSRRLM